ncbi:MAG: MBL fold metallo-hydrolase [Desulfotalea sp.]
MCKLTLTVLVDDIPQDGLDFEHGYSLHIQSSSGAVLLDTGQSSIFATNAKKLGIDLGQLSSLVLSHGHYDHTGGISKLLTINPKIDIFLHKDAMLQKRFNLHGKDAKVVKMGNRARSSILNQPVNKIHWLNEPTEIVDNLWATGPVPRNTSFEDTGGNFTLDSAGVNVDPINDDLSLWYNTSEGLVICLGCCHSGLINTLQYIMKTAGHDKIHTIIGGMHMLNANTQRLQHTAEQLNDLDIKQLIACHCSGEEAISYLSTHAKCDVITGFTGLKLEI